jgi:hypothetical protein
MGPDMFGSHGVVEVPNRTSDHVAMFKEVPYDVIADVSVDA